MKKAIKFINPKGLFTSPAFSQMVVINGPGSTVYIGGQNAADNEGQLVGKGDIARQTGQVMENIETALAAAGGSYADVIKLTIYIVQGQNVNDAFKAAQKFMSKAKNPPIVTGVFVAGLTNPDYLLEIDAVAFIPE